MQMMDFALSKAAHLSSCPWNKGTATQMHQDSSSAESPAIGLMSVPEERHCAMRGFP